MPFACDTSTAGLFAARHVPAVYYLRVVRILYLDPERAGSQRRPVRVGPAMWTALGVGLISILPLAIFANGFVTGAQQAASAIFH